MTRSEIITEFFAKCENVNLALEEDLIDAGDAQRMKDRFREEADQKIAELAKEPVRP